MNGRGSYGYAAFRPIAICLLLGEGSSLEIGVHQVIPEDARSIAKYAERSHARLLHHVVIFTQMTYAECQAEIHREVAALSGSALARNGGCKAIIGDRAAIERAMDALALDASAIAGEPPSSEPGYASEEDDEYGDDDDDDEDEDDEDARGFIDDECMCDETLEDSDDEREVTPDPQPPSVLKRLRRGPV